MTGAAVISRKAQREKFAAAHYFSDRQDLLVADVQVERREQMPNGLWGDPVIVQPYMKDRIVGRAAVELVDDAFTSEDEAYILDLREALRGKEKQAAVLRPPFQSVLAGCRSGCG